MERKYGEFVGVDNLHYALVDDSDAAYTAGTPTYLAPVAEISAEAETNNTPTYYDNVAGNNYVSEGVTTVTITVSNIPVQLAAILLGKKYDAASGRMIDSGQPNPPYVALGYRANIGNSDYRYTWYHKGTFSGGAEEAATKTSDVDIRTYELTYTAVSTTHKWLIDGEETPMKKISGDTTDPAFDPSGWFAQVQTPNTGGAPAALELSSVVPTDDATGVAIDTAIVLTFNNKIASEAIALLDVSTGDPVPVTRAWDLTGKVLTLTPTSDLTAATEYLVSIAGVKDIYGQSLAASGKNFTTA